MSKMMRELAELSAMGKNIQVALVGCGKMGRGLINQTISMKGIHIAVIVEHTPAKGVEALLDSGIEEEKILVTDVYEEAESAVAEGKYVVTADYTLSYRLSMIQAVVDATGRPSFGATLALETMDHGKHIILLNVECDAVVGPYLYDYSKKKNVIYTCSAGDEPGAIMDLANYVDSLGMEILVAGKGKNNALNPYATAEDLREEAMNRDLAPKMLTSFVDGTNTMVELTCIGNALGFLPDVIGAHGITTTPEESAKDFSLIEEGGVLHGYGVVDFAFGMAPGVFIVATTDSPITHNLLRYLGLGEGPNYTFFRPYHLCCLETPRTIYDAVIRREPTLVPRRGQVCDSVSVAKKDIPAGEYLEGIGGVSVYGQITSHADQQKRNLLPVSLITEGSRAKVDIPKDTFITYDMVELDEEELLVQLRRKQDALGL